jgi:seryl-tRNA synthetase
MKNNTGKVFAVAFMSAYKAWDESQHPRHEAGDNKGGEFAPKAAMTYEQIHAMKTDELKSALAAKKEEIKTAKVAVDAFIAKDSPLSLAIKAAEAAQGAEKAAAVEAVKRLDAEQKAARARLSQLVSERDDIGFELEDRG